MFTSSVKSSYSSFVSAKIRDYGLLFKFKLSLTVVFTSVLAFAIATAGSIDFLTMSLLFLGGFLITGSSNALNEVIEKESDKLMERTKNRPLATNRMQPVEAILIAGIAGVGGISLLWFAFNPLASMLGAISLLSYAFIYTPLKRLTPLAVLVGAIPGAMPPLIGWVCATGEIGYEAMSLFSIQFLWQFPHFWAIAWIAHEDYSKAGFKLLPFEDGKSKSTAFLCIIYIVILTVISVTPAIFGYIHPAIGAIVGILGLCFLYPAIQLYKQCDVSSARKLMFGSIAYLPMVMIVLLIGKIAF